jgi:predicted  nucleic acid-binding Zn-ribbon protein
LQDELNKTVEQRDAAADEARQLNGRIVDVESQIGADRGALDRLREQLSTSEVCFIIISWWSIDADDDDNAL